MTRNEAWQMTFGDTTPSEAASDLRGQTAREYVRVAMTECVAACSADEDGLREDELWESLREHADGMAEMIAAV